MNWREIAPYLRELWHRARWPDELEKPDPGFSPSRAGGWFKVSCCWVGPCFAPRNSL